MNDIDRTKLLKLAIGKFGVESQINQTIEECAELIVAINHHRRGKINLKKVIEEIIGVKIMIEQMELIFAGETWDEIEQEQLSKLSEYVTNDKTGKPDYADDRTCSSCRNGADNL